MVRVTLEKDYGKRIRMLCGYEVVVPMQFGGADPDVMVDFRGSREPLPARPNEFFLDWANEDERSTLMPNEYAVLYFGDPRAGSDEKLVRDKVIPNLNDERERVANIWGGYLYSDLHGPYTTIRIAVPAVPYVSVAAVDHNGMTRTSGKPHRPHEFFDFAAFLDPNAEAELEQYRARRRGPITASAREVTLDISNLSKAQLTELAAAIAKQTKAAS
jgi:hypothetical protein